MNLVFGIRLRLVLQQLDLLLDVLRQLSRVLADLINLPHIPLLFALTRRANVLHVKILETGHIIIELFQVALGFFNMRNDRICHLRWCLW